jgi:hypothetical protein
VTGEVFFINDLAKPLLHHGAVDVVVVNPLFIPGIVRRVNVDALNFSCISRQKGFESDKVVAVYYEIVIEADFVCEAFVFLRYKLMMLYRKVMILDKRLAFKIQRSHLLAALLLPSSSGTQIKIPTA